MTLACTQAGSSVLGTGDCSRSTQEWAAPYRKGLMTAGRNQTDLATAAETRRETSFWRVFDGSLSSTVTRGAISSSFFEWHSSLTASAFVQTRFLRLQREMLWSLSHGFPSTQPWWAVNRIAASPWLIYKHPVTLCLWSCFYWIFQKPTLLASEVTGSSIVRMSSFFPLTMKPCKSIAKAEEDPKLFRTWLFSFQALREKSRQELDPRMSLAREKLSAGKPGCLLGGKAKMSTKALKCCSLSAQYLVYLPTNLGSYWEGSFNSAHSKNH